ncbi:MAG TPA: efflux RND transporter periplasmic adaptor subunit [Longimicrobiales bacterium]
MNNRKKQIVFSTALIAVALGVVGTYALVGSDEQTPAAGGHDHAAMAGGLGDAKPVTLDAESARRIGVAYATAEIGDLSRTVRTVGSVTFDETRLVSVSPRIEGWVEHLYVDFTGAPVRRGQPLMAVYSPMLVAAQEELILAARLARDASEGAAADNARNLLDAARRRLAYWEVAPEDIARIERTGVTQKTITLRAPASGLVVEKDVFEGGRIMPGMNLYRIADLSTVWVEGEVFEKDLGLVGLGREVRITLDAYPGESFIGRVTYVYPTVSQETRTGRIRVELPNRTLKFKPGMYANVEFDVPVHLDGLHVPRSAVLTTGTRSLVFVQHADGSLVPHEVTVGRAAGDHVEILGGLTAGQVVVASAGFLVDAESNLGAAMSGMGDGSAPAVNTADPHAGH